MKRNRLLGPGAALLLLLGCESFPRLPDLFPLPPPPSPSPGPTPGNRTCGATEAWDRDGDTISDSIERNNQREGYLPLDPDRCDADPSAPLGSYADGQLRGGLNLTDRGTGYRHVRGSDAVDTDDWGTLELVNCLEATSRQLDAAGRALTVLDLSRRGGGAFYPHRAHQNGLEADLRYLRKDGREAPLDLRLEPSQHASRATRQLFRSLVRRCEVAVIFVDLGRLGFGNDDLPRPVLVDAPGHSNHFHLRLENRR